jgi:hypothetical protein
VWLDDWFDDWLDLALGSACVGCARPGRLLCPDCRDALPLEARAVGPGPGPARRAPPHGAAG